MRVGDWLRHFGGEIKKRKRKKPGILEPGCFTHSQITYLRAFLASRTAAPPWGGGSPGRAEAPQLPQAAGASSLTALPRRGQRPFCLPGLPLYKYTPQDRVLLPSPQREAGGLKPPRSRGGANGRGEAGSGARCDGGRAATPGPRAAGTAPAALPRPCWGSGVCGGGKTAEKGRKLGAGEVMSSSGLAGFVVVIVEID